MRDTTWEARTNLYETFSHGPLHKDVAVLADQQELTYNSSLRAQKNLPGVRDDRFECRERERERESGKFLLSAWLDDDIYSYNKTIRLALIV